ncbi:exodeoxyribonuclease V subunit gamma [Francisellaceae bacterium CB300]
MALYTYPSNKLEYLVEVLSKLLSYEKKGVFDASQLIVGSRGMQHWLSMQLAETRGIAMNLKFDMVNGFIVDLCYELTDKQEYKKAYTKEVLTWRVYKFLDDDKNSGDSGSESGMTGLNYSKLKEYYQNSLLKKYQLSVKIAETFSRYLTYRIDWLEKWEKNQTIDDTKVNEDELWQMQLWQILVAEISDTPYKVQEEAIRKLSKTALEKHKMPENIYVFGVNTISPKNMNFINKLAEYIDIHILYINPCSEYWYDLKKEKISAWLGQEDYENQPLLANLGQQGKEFFNELLDNQDKQEIEVFEKSQLDFEKLEQQSQTQLISLQRNLLELNCENYSESKDDSITINSCHSPLREVQVLHDKLLDMVASDSNIKPRDILVMCPSIEDYSPYIDSVFSRFPEKSKLPCSIADRTLLDSEPLAASFIDLLQLPESDFEVNKILDYLSVPAIQQKFSISDDQLETIRYWLKEACIHHSNDGATFSWSWGLKRLMLGFSYADSGEIVDSKMLTVPVIDGNDVVELGGLYELMELLAEYSQELTKERTAEEWQNYLFEMLENVFDTTNEEAFIYKKIKDIIAKVTQIPQGIASGEKLDLYTIRYCMVSQLSEPIINNHFLNGKVTFCSMTPMRNVPFKVVAMLGLNNGKFPRQESAISFDLMARLGRNKGDRVQRDDDRYLFLESILSAREYLYLSFVGRSVKTNTEQESSLVLKELESYLQQNYGWTKDDIKEYSLHAFSEKCYSDNYRSYDERWLKLITSHPREFCTGELTANAEPKLASELSVQELVRIFENPLKTYAKATLELNLEDYSYELEDSEPFDIAGLEKHQLKSDLLKSITDDDDVSTTKQLRKLSGKLPESMLTDIMCEEEYTKLENLVLDVELSRFIKEHFEVEIDGHKLKDHAYIFENELRLFTISRFGIKQKFELYLTALLAYVYTGCEYAVSCYYIDDKDNVKSEHLSMNYANAKNHLKHYLQIVKEMTTRPMLAHLNLAEAVLSYVKESQKKDAKLVSKSTHKKQEDWEKVISDDNNPKALDKDEYFKLFYPQNPHLEEFVHGVYDEFFEVINK